ncbi:hypothetical protein QR90_11335 [Deinococcus radiopugnans]|uniref:Uncharacterized protein n=1 Tax=Deinococcus radiopugnans TaxID=57497 RepID=A0A0A7KLU6_9DEIO|nr:hypothetical protein [Deinococcus radiopugnans]AIZ45548.1 hypothetical protein QR90_11335 [Deinococcus radiopugnans]
MRLRPAPTLLAAAALCALGACRRDTQAGHSEDLVAKVLFTATGSYDAQADQKERRPGTLRLAVWNNKPPLPVQKIVLYYDSEVRPRAWFMNLSGAQFTAQALAGQGAAQVQTPQGQGWRPAQGTRLEDVLILPTGQGSMNILTRAYVTQREPELLGAFEVR